MPPNKGLEHDGERRGASLATVPRGSAPGRWAGGRSIKVALPPCILALDFPTALPKDGTRGLRGA
jgi:hypothetical protein